MRVLILTPSFLPLRGGLEVALDHLARHLVRQGHAVSVLAEQPRRGMAPVADAPYAVRHRRRALSQRGGYAGLRRTARAWHRERDFDVIAAHMAYPAGWVAARLGAEIGRPVVVTCHGGDVSAGSRWRARPALLARLVEGLRRAAAVTAVSEELAQAVSELAPGVRCRVIPNGVDPTIAVAVERPPDAPVGPRPFALYLKRFHEAKGHGALIAAWGRLLDAGVALPDLVLAGDGPGLEARRAQVAALGLGDRIHLPGAVVDPLRRWLLQSCRFFVHPSEREGMPVVLLEAMACGRAVVAVRAEGVASMVVPGETGLLVPPGDGAALEAALVRVADRDLAARWGEAGARRAAAFTWDAVARRYAGLFAEVST